MYYILLNQLLFKLTKFLTLFVENPSNWEKILQSLHLSSNIDFYYKFYQPLMQDRIKTIITASWAKAVEQTEKNIREIFESSAATLNGNVFILAFNWFFSFLNFFC